MSHQRKKPFEPPGKKARFSVDEDAADGILPSEDPLRFLGFYDGQLKFNPPIVDDSLDPSKWSCFNPNEACYIRTYDENGKLLSKVFTTEERVVEDGKRVMEMHHKMRGDPETHERKNESDTCQHCFETPCIMVTNNAKYFARTGDLMKEDGVPLNRI